MTAGAETVGWDTSDRRWCVYSGQSTWIEAPHVEGTVILDDEIRERAGRDQGNVARVLPGAVLRPGDVEDIAAMMRFCRAQGIRVAPQGTKHTTYGQALVDGLAIDMRSLSRIHAVRDGAIDVDAGALWREVVTAGWQHRLRLRSGPPGYLGLTVGGVLSVGGINSLYREAAIADRVLSLQVVTGTGEQLWCSPDQNTELLDSVLGTLGQCGIITRAILEMTPVPSRARQWTWTYQAGTEDAHFFRDLRRLAQKGYDELVTIIEQGDPTQYHLHATVYYEPHDPPCDDDGRRLLSRLPSATEDNTYLTHISRTDNAYQELEPGWNEKTKVFADYFLPAQTAETFVTNVVSELTPRDCSQTSATVLYLKKPSKLPFFRMPTGHHADESWVYLLDVLSDSTPDDTTFIPDMLQRNHRWYQQAQAAGGLVYPNGSTLVSQTDWEQHYGAAYALLQERKKQFDPAGILGPTKPWPTK